MAAALMTFVGCVSLHVPQAWRPAVKPAVARRAATVVMDEESEAYLVPFTNVTAAAAEIKEVLAKEGFSEAEASEAEAPDAEATAALKAVLAGLTDEELAALANKDVSDEAEATAPYEGVSEAEATAPYEGFSEAEATAPYDDFSDAEMYAPYGAIVPMSDAEAAAKASWLANTYSEQQLTPTFQDAAAPAMTPEIAALTDERNELYAALEWQGYDPEKVQRLNEVEAMLADAASAEPEASPLVVMTQAVADLFDEKKELDAALELGYDAEKVKRLAEVEAILAEADVSAPVALSPEEAAKAKWLAERARPSWDGNYDAPLY